MGKGLYSRPKHEREQQKSIVETTKSILERIISGSEKITLKTQKEVDLIIKWK